MYRYVAIVKNITGTAYVTGVDGVRRRLEVGDKISTGDIVESSSGTNVVLAYMDDGSIFNMGSNNAWLARAKDDIKNGVASSLQDDFDPTIEEDAPAAGNVQQISANAANPANDGGTGTSVNLNLTSPTVTPIFGYQTEGLTFDALADIPYFVAPGALPDNTVFINPTVTIDIPLTVDTPLSPIAVNELDSVVEDVSSVTRGNVLSNDFLGSNPLPFPVLNAGSYNGLYGTLVLNADGTYTYQLNNANPNVQNLNSGQSLSDAFTYTITNANGQTSSATLSVQINGFTDAPPVAVQTPPVAVNEINLVTENIKLLATGNVLSNDFLGTSPATSPVVNAGNYVGLYGTLVLNSNGTYTYQLNDKDLKVNALKTGESLSDAFSYTIKDANGQTSTATLSIQINGFTDQLPAMIIPQSAPIDEGKTAYTNISWSDPNGGFNYMTIAGRKFTLSELQKITGSNVVSIETANGVLTISNYKHTAAGNNTLNFEFDSQNAKHNNSGSTVPGVVERIGIQLTDSQGLSTSNAGAWRIIILDTKPTATADTVSISENATPDSVTGNVLTNDKGGDPPLQVTSTGTFTSKNGYGTLIINADGTFKYTLNNNNDAVNKLNTGESLIDTYQYTITDADGSTSSSTINIKINGVSDTSNKSMSTPDSLSFESVMSGSDLALPPHSGDSSQAVKSAQIIQFDPSKEKFNLGELLVNETSANILDFVKLDLEKSTLLIHPEGRLATEGHQMIIALQNPDGSNIDWSQFGASASQIVQALVAGVDPIFKIDAA